MRDYIAIIEFSYYGTYTEELYFTSGHRANSKANKEDAMREWAKVKERGIVRNSRVLETYLA